MEKLKMLHLALSLCILFSVAAFTDARAQTSAELKKAQTANKAQEEKPFMYVSQMPEFEGGEASFRKFMLTNLEYPAKGAEGTSFASFIVEKDGSVTDVEIKRSVNTAIDKETIRVLKLTSGKWKPGKQNGKVVRVQLTLPVQFASSETK